VVLTFDKPTRTRVLQIAPGLAASNKQRELQPLPTKLAVAFDNGSCQIVPLTLAPIQNEIPLDSKTAVKQVTIGIVSATTPANSQRKISFTEVALLQSPS
jgi:hypothetical protein